MSTALRTALIAARGALDIPVGHELALIRLVMNGYVNLKEENEVCER